MIRMSMEEISLEHLREAVKFKNNMLTRQKKVEKLENKRKYMVFKRNFDNVITFVDDEKFLEKIKVIVEFINSPKEGEEIKNLMKLASNQLEKLYNGGAKK